ncbi:TPA: LacI family DNA-binding transcriptional regulator [Serratia odorifera]|jgi:LacI family transcriptional regulator, sucrose operon repressor|uniref:Catabolite repressor/activator n=1 Tax=Serratia odorifera TaxID=618 RepID=A0A3S4DI16_SEROD|nr:LacI family DNA-binding transcriptional regulator [Serratia odorifera]MBJ2066792.1 LacI family DNA-binding transcriptional regulator [Serratia odorifera]PNK90964.1 LacI family DNA-binding transcriptional regulator [Serratia odorifera]RII72215.1 LacI family DNA-binding transcriptional regulator [Serratia odorifera]VDZ57419.1 Catabolite repressor/activator [Serratia odorifera]HEJ9096144.1 LacI family DNA-binding transcriptional regulator [Serratia odorifera]
MPLVKKNKRVTITDIAAQAGVSKSTASLVLNGRSKEYRVSDETRDRILALASELHYQPSIHARSLRSHRSHTLGLVVPEMTNYGFAVIARELETLCREAGLQLLIACSDENPAQEMMAVNSLVQRQVDGLIVASSQLNDAEYQKINASLPVVQMDRLINGSTLPLVITDSVASTAQLVETVARQHPDEFYFLGGQPRISPTRDRLAGFQLGLERAGIVDQPEWIIHGTYHPSSGYEMFAGLCAHLGRPPKALFTAACGLLEGVLRYLTQHQLIDSDIHLCSFDDHYLFDCMTLKIDTVAQDCRGLAQHSFEMVTQLIDERPLAQSTLFLPGSIHWRHAGSLAQLAGR